MEILKGIDENLKIIIGILTSAGILMGFLWKPIKSKIKNNKEQSRKQMKELITESNEPIRVDIAKLGDTQEKMCKEISTLKKDIDVDKVESIRAYLLEFVGDTKSGRLHTVEEIEEWYRKYDKYEKLIEKYNLSNSYLENAYIVVSNEYKSLKK